MPYHRLKNRLAFTGSQKYFSCLVEKLWPTAIQSICKGVGRLIKGKARVAKGDVSSRVLSKDLIWRLPAFVLGEDLCRKSGQVLFAWVFLHK